MQIPTSLLMMGALHLVLLITAVYLIVFLKMYYSVRFSLLDIFLLVMQVLNLVLLLQYIVGYEGVFLTANGNYHLLFMVQGIFIFLLLIRFIMQFRKVLARSKESLLPQSIREAINYLPGGICFSTPEGRSILTNYRMNELIHRLTNHTIMNAKITWEELRQLGSANGCLKLEDLWVNQDKTNGATDECMYFSLPDSSVWRFRKETLADRLPHYIQLEATEISDLYRYSKELYENNKRLVEQYERQQNLLADIVEINHEKEILSTKMRIHDDLGRSIITTKLHLSNLTLSENIPYLTEMWNNTIRSLADFTRIYEDAKISPEIELHRAADMIGCQIHYHGDRPVGRKTVLLFYAAVREALTNAVIHAKANHLNVTITPTGPGYHVAISDNGTITLSSITEGSGLGNLRQKLEQEGATLQVSCEEGVTLMVELPAERKDLLTQEERKEW